MKSKIILILFCFLFSEQLFSQKFNFRNDSINKNWTSAGIGGHFSCFSQDKHIKTSGYIHGGNVSNQFAGFWIKNSYSINIKALFLKQYKHFLIKASLNYFNRKRIYESDSNEIKKYNQFDGSSYKDIIKYTINPNNIILSLGIGYGIKRNFFLGAINISSNFYYHNILINKYEEKIIENYSIFNKYRPTYYYEHRINYYPEIIYFRKVYKDIQFFIGIDYFQNYFTFQTGLNMILDNK